MRDAFTYILNMSITAGYVIIAVLFIRMLLIKVPKKYSYFLWSVVAFRLLIPKSFESLFSLFSLKAFDMTSAQTGDNGMLEYVPSTINPQSASTDISVGIPSANAVINDTISAASVSSNKNIVDIFMNYFACVWFAVMIIILLYGLISYIALRIKLSNAVCRSGNVYESDKVASPFILGFLSPKIYIPFNLDDETCSYVTAHEKCHLARYDYCVKALAFVLLAVHWFNPLCYIAFYLMTKDMEMSCDEKVLSDNISVKKNYSTALLSLAADRKFTRLTPLCFSESSVKARIKNVLNFKKPKPAVSIIAALLCISLIVGCASNPIKSENKEEDISDKNIVVSYDNIELLHIGRPEILFADSQKLILYGNFGLIIYDLNKYEIADRVPLSELEALGVTDAYATEIGKAVYFYTTNNNKNLSGDYAVKYRYILETKKMEEFDFPFSTVYNKWEPYDLLEDSPAYKKYVDSEMLDFNEAAIVDNYMYFLQSGQNYGMFSLMLIKVDLNKELVVREAFIFDNINTLSDTLKIEKIDSMIRSAYYVSYEKYGSVPNMISALTGAEYVGDKGSGLHLYSFKYDEHISIFISTAEYAMLDPISVVYYLDGEECASRADDLDILLFN